MSSLVKTTSRGVYIVIVCTSCEANPDAQADGLRMMWVSEHVRDTGHTVMVDTVASVAYEPAGPPLRAVP